MRIVFMGTVEFSHTALASLLDHPAAELVGVVTRRSSSFNADFRSLEPLAQQAGVPCLTLAGRGEARLEPWLAERRPDVLYCFGWSYLLSRAILKVPRLGVIGYHPAALPRNRGRHPLIWALVLGLSETASTFFFMDEGADSGDILAQERVPISLEDDAASLYERLMEVGCRQIATFTGQLASGDYPRVSQDPSLATSWRKRGPADGEIDWRMSARSVYNLVRGLTRPYVGAHCRFAGGEAKVWRCTEHRGEVAPDHEPGKVLAVDGRRVVVKCGEGAVELMDHELPELPAVGAYL